MRKTHLSVGQRNTAVIYPLVRTCSLYQLILQISSVSMSLWPIRKTLALGMFSEWVSLLCSVALIFCIRNIQNSEALGQLSISANHSKYHKLYPPSPPPQCVVHFSVTRGANKAL